MSERPSAPLLKVLRTLIKQKKLNTAAVAASMGIERGRARKVLAGAADMTVDELLRLGGVLDLAPADLALAGLMDDDAVEALDAVPAPSPTPRVVDAGAAEVVEPDAVVLDDYGNHPHQLFRVGIALGCDFMFLLDVAAIEDSGVPKAVLRQHEKGELPIRLDAAYHPYNAPIFSDDEVTVTLSFDALYTCTFAWSAFRQFIFFPAIPESAAAETPEPAAPADPTLRLVT